MQLSDFKLTWQQFKLANSLEHVESQEILAIIDSEEFITKSSLQRVLLNIAMFVAIIIICQGG